MEQNINTAIIERLERVVDTLSENSIKMGQLLAVHNEKLDKQDQIDQVLFEKVDRLHADLNRETDSIKRGCERDIRKVDDRLRVMEKKMWTIFGGLSIISVIVSPIGQQMIKNLQPRGESVIINPTQIGSVEPSRQQIHISSLV